MAPKVAIIYVSNLCPAQPLLRTSSEVFFRRTGAEHEIDGGSR